MFTARDQAYSRHMGDPDAESNGGAGPPVAFPASLSPSRANDFLTCPLMYRLRNIDRLPELPSPAAIRGSLVHRALEWLYTEPPSARTPATAQALLIRAWGELREHDPDAAGVLASDSVSAFDPTAPDQVTTEILAATTPLLEGYFALENPARLEPHAREMAVSAQLEDGLTIRGFVDRVDRTPDGDIRIVDYKTGRSPRAGFETKAMFQMRFYALTWWRMTREVPRLLMLLYLGDQQALTYAPAVDDLVATERKVIAIRDAISTSAATGTFAAKPSRLCDWCSYQALCPAKGGMTPPMPALPTSPAARRSP